MESSTTIFTTKPGSDFQRALYEWDAFKQKHHPGSTMRNGSLYQWLDAEMAQKIIDQLQVILDSEEDSLDYRKKCLSLLHHLSKKFQMLPSALVVEEIQREGENPVAGGGFADIWRGTLNGKFVCLKVLRLNLEPDEKARAEIRKQFSREALVWRQLRHPNILPLLGVNSKRFSPSFCLISPWMGNGDIITYLRQNPTHDIPSVLREISAGLHYLHTRNPPIIHGDIRGGNILVTDDFRCCLADFGLTLVTTVSQAWSITTSTSATKGAMRWLAPEYIITGSVPNHTSRDVYAFGCTILEILTQKPPFHDHNNDASVLLKLIGGGRPERPQGIWCPDAIWSLTTNCWAQVARDRPSASQICKSLEQAVVFSREPARGSLFTNHYLSVSLSRDKNRHASATEHNEAFDQDSRPQKRLKADDPQSDAPSYLPPPLIGPFTSPQSRGGPSSNVLGNGNTRLRKILPPAQGIHSDPSISKPQDMRRPHSAYNVGPSHHPPNPIRTADFATVGPIGTPSGSFPLGMDLDSLPSEYKREGSDWFVIHNPEVEKVLDVRLVRTLEHESVVRCLRFSPDGRYLATGGDRIVRIFDVSTGYKTCVLVDDSVVSNLFIISVCFSPDGRYLATGARDKRIRIWDLREQKIRHILDGHQGIVLSLIFSADGRLLVSGSDDGTARVWDMTDATPKILIINDTNFIVTSVAISPDGQVVAVGSLHSIVRIWDITADVLIEQLRGHTDSIESVAFTPDGTGLISGSRDKTLKYWDISNLIAKRRKEANGAETKEPDSSLEVTTMRRVKDQQSRCTLNFVGHKNYVWSVAVSYDGNWVASGSKDCDVLFWDPRTAIPQLMLRGHKNSVVSVDFSPETNLLATGGLDKKVCIWSYVKL